MQNPKNNKPQKVNFDRQIYQWFKKLKRTEKIVTVIVFCIGLVGISSVISDDPSQSSCFEYRHSSQMYAGCLHNEFWNK